MEDVTRRCSPWSLRTPPTSTSMKEALRHQQLGFIRQSNLAMQWLVSPHVYRTERNPLPTVSQSFCG